MARGVEFSAAWKPCPYYEQAVPAFVRATRQFPDDYPDLDVEEGGAWAELPFYRSFRLFDFVVTGFALEKPYVYALGSEFETHWLGGSVDPILRANEVDRLQLTEDTVLDYLQFFLFFVRGKGGAYRIIDSPSQIFPADMTTEQLATLAKHDDRAHHRLTRLRHAQQLATPIQVGAIDEGARFAVRGATVFGEQLLNCVFVVERSGEVRVVMDPEALDLSGLRTESFVAIRLEP